MGEKKLNGAGNRRGMYQRKPRKPAETRTVAQEAVEGVVEFPYCVSPEMREGMTHCAYVRMAKTLPIGTRVRVTALPKEAE